MGARPQHAQVPAATRRADRWITPLRRSRYRQVDAKVFNKVFKKYSQMKLQMKREALEKINRQANEAKGFDTVNVQ